MRLTPLLLSGLKVCCHFSFVRFNPLCNSWLCCAKHIAEKSIFVREVQSHSFEWLKLRSEEADTPHTEALVTCPSQQKLIWRETKKLDEQIP